MFSDHSELSRIGCWDSTTLFVVLNAVKNPPAAPDPQPRRAKCPKPSTKFHEYPNPAFRFVVLNAVKNPPSAPIPQPRRARCAKPSMNCHEYTNDELVSFVYSCAFFVDGLFLSHPRIYMKNLDRWLIFLWIRQVGFQYIVTPDPLNRLIVFSARKNAAGFELAATKVKQETDWSLHRLKIIDHLSQFIIRKLVTECFYFDYHLILNE